MKRFIAAIVIAVMCLCLCSCGYNPKEVGAVKSADGKEYVITCGRYLICQFSAADTAVYTVDSTGSTSLEKVLEGTVEGEDARQWISAETERLLIRAAAIDRMAEELGLEFTPEEKYIYEYSIGYGWNNYYSIYMANGISHDTFYDYQMNMAMDNELPVRIYGTGGTRELSDELVQEYIDTKTARISFIYTPYTKKDGTSVTEDEYALLDELAKKLLEDVKANGFDAAVEAYKPLYEAILGEGCFDDAYTEDQLTIKGDGNYADGVYDAVLAVSPNEYGLYDAGGHSYCVFRRETLQEGDTVAALKDKVAAIEGPELLTEMFAEYIKGWTVELDQKAVKYYSVDKVTFS